ncbi:MAG: VOC family protein [Ilumatobacteraceae bacterium]
MTCPGWPGSGARCSAGRFSPSASGRSSSARPTARPSASASCQAPDDKVVKNRVHIDLNPGPDTGPSERQAEIERLVALGARPVDVGQRGDETWTVLADPEGNEFRVVRPKKTLTS